MDVLVVWASTETCLALNRPEPISCWAAVCWRKWQSCSSGTACTWAPAPRVSGPVRVNRLSHFQRLAAQCSSLGTAGWRSTWAENPIKPHYYFRIHSEMWHTQAKSYTGKSQDQRRRKSIWCDSEVRKSNNISMAVFMGRFKLRLGLVQFSFQLEPCSRGSLVMLMRWSPKMHTYGLENNYKKQKQLTEYLLLSCQSVSFSVCCAWESTISLQFNALFLLIVITVYNIMFCLCIKNHKNCVEVWGQ